MNRLDEARRLREEAKDHLLRAAAALTTIDGAEFAVLEACLGLLRLAEADPEGRVRGRLEARLREARRADAGQEAEG